MTLERHGVWGWRLAGAVAAILLYYYVIEPGVRAACRELGDTIAAETTEP